MNIADMRVRITIQKSEQATDAIGNHLLLWEDYFMCWAEAKSPKSTIKQDEANVAAQTLEADRLDFIVRYCIRTSAVNSTGYRIFFKGDIYNIKHVDFQGFKNKEIKLSCVLARRS